MKKIIKDSTQREKKAKSGSRSAESYQYLDEYQDLLVMKSVPVSKTFLERLGTDWVQWAREKSEEPLYDQRKILVLDFFSEKGIGWSTLKRWCDRYPFFNEQYTFGKNLLGGRRERAAFWKKSDPGIFLKSAAKFDDQWRELEEWRAQLAAMTPPEATQFTRTKDFYTREKEDAGQVHPVCPPDTTVSST